MTNESEASEEDPAAGAPGVGLGEIGIADYNILDGQGDHGRKRAVGDGHGCRVDAGQT